MEENEFWELLKEAGEHSEDPPLSRAHWLVLKAFGGDGLDQCHRAQIMRLIAGEPMSLQARAANLVVCVLEDAIGGRA